jgi:hypothetical protein
MKLHELIERAGSIESVIDLFRQNYADLIQQGCERNKCGLPAREFENFAADHGFPMVERVQGKFRVDTPETDIDAFSDREKKLMIKQGFDLKSEADRIRFAEKNGLMNDLKIIPHQWNEYRDEIIDFTGKAQFVDTGLASDTDRSRYLY